MSSNLRRLEKFGVHHIIYEFDGYGGDGEIHSVEFQDKDGKEIYAYYADYPEGFGEALIDMEDEAYDKISDTGEDWVTNDGGFGELKYDLTEGRWYSSIRINRRYYESTLVHEHINEPVKKEEEDE